MKKLLSFLGALSVIGSGACSVISCSSDSSIVPLSKRDYSDFSNVPAYSYIPTNSENSKDLNAWANDPVSILYNDGTNGQPKGYYSWELFRNGRGFTSNWIEMFSPDMKTWKQTAVRLQEGREFFKSPGKSTPGVVGGSVFLDKTGKYTGHKGAALFIVSLEPSTIMKNEKGIQEKITRTNNGIAYFVAEGGLGTPINYGGSLAQHDPYLDSNPVQHDWRDTFVFERTDPTTKQSSLYFAISSWNKIEFWKINSLTNGSSNFTGDVHKNDRIEYMSSILVRPQGVEVPNVAYLGNNKWYISCSAQDNPIKGPFQTTYWFICTFDGKTFTTINSGRHEYGPEAYAQRVNDPYQTENGTNILYSRTMPSNWNYDTDIWAWKGGAYTTDQVDIKNDKAYEEPLDSIKYQDYNESTKTAVYDLKAKDLQEFKLHFNYGDFYVNFDNNKKILTWKNDIDTGLKKWTNNGGHTEQDDSIRIVYNACTLTIYNMTQGWVAHFMLPQNIKHTPTDISHIDGATIRSWVLTNETTN